MIELENLIWSLGLSPERGASIISCDCMGFPVLAPARPEFDGNSDAFASSCFPLVPYSNRIANGTFAFMGRSHRLAANHPGQALPIHGNGWDVSWEVDGIGKTYCDLSMTYAPKIGGWPWAFRAKQTIELLDNKLIFRMSIENTDTEAFPAGIGLHPFFAGAAIAKVKFKAAKFWNCDENLIPTSSQSLVLANDFSSPKSLTDLRIDNCYSNWNGIAEISWPDFDRHITMEASSVFSNLVVYVQPENEFFCLEPVSHINNALNMGGENAMQTLLPGENLKGTISFRPGLTGLVRQM